MRTRSRKGNSLLGLSTVIGNWLLTVGGVGSLIALSYLAYGIFSQSLAAYPTLSFADQSRLSQNVYLAVRILHFSAMAMMVGILIRKPGEFGGGYALAVIGAGIAFGFPLLLRNHVMEANYVTQMMGYWLSYTGKVLLIIGIAGSMIDAGYRFKRAMAKSLERWSLQAQVKQAQGELVYQQTTLTRLVPRVFTPCWKLPVCQTYVRNLCPVFKKGRSCWRKKRGCLCDPDFLVEALNNSKDFKKSDLNWALNDPSRPAGSEVKCKSCPIFLEHQREKHRTMTYMVVPEAFATMYFLYPWLDGLYKKGLLMLYGVMSQFSFSATTTGQQIPSWVTTGFESQLLEWMLLISMGMWIMHLYQQVTDYTVLSLKL